MQMRQCGIILGIFIDGYFALGGRVHIDYANFPTVLRVPATTTIVFDFVVVFASHAEIQHIVAVFAESHLIITAQKSAFGDSIFSTVTNMRKTMFGQT